jgi:hemolysin D
MLVSKLRGKQVPLPVHRPLRAQPSVPEALAGNPVDVEYTPVEAATSEPSDLQGTAPEAPAAEPPQVSASQAPVAKPLGMQGMALETALNRPLWKPEPVPAVTVARPQGAQTPAPEPTIDTPLPKPEAMPAMPAAGRQSAQESAPETIDTPLPRPEPMSESPAKPEGAQGSALGTAVGKLLRRQDAEPEARVSEPRPTQVAAAGKSVGKLLRLPRRTRDEREFLPAALEIVDTPPSPVGRAVGLTIIALAVIAIAWACIGRVDIVATASGRIVPQGKTKIVQPADTGIVTAIHVADNDHVKAGDVLIELNSIQSLADRDRFARDLLQANLNLARLRGLAATLPGTKGEGREPDLVDPPKAAKPEDIALTLAAMRAQATNESAKLADLDQQIEAKQAEAAEAEASAEKLQASLPMLADQEQLLRTMRDQKIGSKLDWYQVNQQLIEQQHEIGVLSHRKDAAAAAQRALKEQRQAEATQFQMQVLSELDKARTQASELEAELAKAEQRLRQGVLHAPIDGTVQQLAIHTIGGVVTPAEALLAIVPDDDSLVVEAAVQNRDVGFIRAGQTVRVKVEAFNFTLYGLIDGKVLDVTRDTVSHPANDKKSKDNNQDDGDGVASDQSGPVYLARIALAQDWMMTENGKVNLTPGMAVTAEIQTGERRLISYLLSPLTRHVSESMHER